MNFDDLFDFDGLKQNDYTYGNQSGGNKFWRPSPGENVIRGLPPTLKEKGLNYFTIPYNQHWVNIEKGHSEVFRCLRDDPDTRKCPACTFFFQNRDDDDEDIARMANEFRNSTRHLMNILVIETESKNDDPEGVQVYEFGPGPFKDIKPLVQNVKRYGNFFHPKKGRNLIVTMTHKNESDTGRNKYSVLPDSDPSDVSHLLQADSEWKEKVESLGDNVPDIPSRDFVLDVVATAAELVGADAPSGGKARTVSAAPQTTDSDVEEDDEDDIDLDDDSSDEGDDSSDDTEDEDTDDVDDIFDDDDLDF